MLKLSSRWARRFFADHGVLVLGLLVAINPPACERSSRSPADSGAGGNPAGNGGAASRPTGGSGGASDSAGAASGGSEIKTDGGVAGQAGSGSAASGGTEFKTDGGAVGQAGDAGTSLAPDSLAVRFANMIISHWPDPAGISSSKGFEYNHGIVLRGLEQVFRRTGDPRYLAYIKKYVDENVNESGVVTLATTHSFDIIQPSVLLPFLYQETGAVKYRTAADSIRLRYDTIPRNADRGFWHKDIYPNQMWLDSIYMGETFLARYGAVFGSCGGFCGDTVVEQSLLIAQHTLDTPTGLHCHAWDDSPAGQKAAWADPTTGRSPSIWGRAEGWYAMALVDTLGDLPADQSGRSDMLSILAGIAAGLKATQDPTTGLWYQVLDQGNQSDNWLESSASGIFIYTLKVAVQRGYIDSSYLSVAESGWKGLQTKVVTDSAGLITITDAVQGMGVEASYAGYVGHAKLSNSPHGLCAILLAASEMEAR
jgi:unsaturated rhamnogalacturonyl hydrolase